jgi:hypothetical protein
MHLNPEVATTGTHDEGAVLLDERTGRYWQLNATGALVLRLLLVGQAPELIAAALAARFHLAPDRAGADVIAVTEQLRAERLVMDQ